MSVDQFTFNHTTGGALRFFDAKTGKVYDFADGDFKTDVAAATTPKIALTSGPADSLGTGRQINYGDVDLARFHRGPTPKRFAYGKYAGTSPAAGITPTEFFDDLVVQFGERGPADVRVISDVTCRTLEGYAVQMSARVERGGLPVNLMACGRALFTVNTGTDVITSVGHGRSNGDAIVFHTIVGGTLPGGLTADTAFYVINANTDDLQVSATPGGSAVDLTSTGTGPYFWDVPTCTVTIREHGSGVDSFTKTLTAADIINNSFEGENPEGTAFTVNTGTDVITATSHGLSDTNQFVVTTGPNATLPAPLAENTNYFARDTTANTLKAAATSGGTAIDITTAGTGVFSILPATDLFHKDRQYEVTVSMVLAGQTIAGETKILNWG